MQNFLHLAGFALNQHITYYPDLKGEKKKKEKKYLQNMCSVACTGSVLQPPVPMLISTSREARFPHKLGGRKRFLSHTQCCANGLISASVKLMVEAPWSSRFLRCLFFSSQPNMC